VSTIKHVSLIPFAALCPSASKSSLQGPQEFDCCAFGFKAAMVKTSLEDHRISLFAKNNARESRVVVEHGNLLDARKTSTHGDFCMGLLTNLI